MFVWAVLGWRQLRPSSPRPQGLSRVGASMAYLDGRLFVFGGCSSTEGRAGWLDDMFIYDLGKGGS